MRISCLPGILSILLGMVLIATAATLTRGQPAAPDPAPVLFNGTSLDGWEGNANLWRVESGVIIGTVAGNLDRNEFLISKHKLKDFRLTLEVNLTTDGNNSGIQFRSAKVDERGHPSVKGYQADIGGPNNQFWGMLYEEHGREWLSEKSLGRFVENDAWNTYEILAVGDTIKTAINGREAVNMVDPDGADDGVIALQLHSGGPMEVRFRSFRLELNPDTTLKTLLNDRNVYAPAPGSGLTVDAAAKAMTVPAGFTVDPVAGEPMIHQPIAMAWDGRGRLWIAEAFSYPVRRETGLDRIVILEDSDGDGSFESRKTFAEGLNLVSGLEVGYGGVWVGAAPHLLFIPDENGDDVPDSEPHILLDGWGDQDTHETLSSFVWGPDGWLYGCQGVFIRSMIGKPGSQETDRTEFSAGIWRYHPVRHEFEVFAHGGSNQWGVDFNDLGHAFMATCRSRNGGGDITHVAHGGYYWRQAGGHHYPHAYQVMLASADHGHGMGGSGGSDELYGGHAHCGAMIYLGDNWPAEYRDRFYTFNLHGKKANQEINVRSGSTYITRHADSDFLFANDYWFMGLNLRVGPDGTAYMIDWYDRQACHHRDIEKWDRTNGRVYRVRYGDLKPAKPNVPGMTDEQLAGLMSHTNDWWVREARKELAWRASKRAIAPAAIDAMKKLARGGETTRRLRAMWALHVIGAFDETFATALIRDTDEDVRSWAIQLTLEDGRANGEILGLLAQIAQRENSPTALLYVTSAMQRLNVHDRWEIAEALLSRGTLEMDRNLPLMAWFAVEPLVETDLTRALSLADASRVHLVRQNILRRASLMEEGRDAVAAIVASAGEPNRRLEALGQLATAMRGRRGVPAPASWSTALAAMRSSGNEWARREAEMLSARFGDVSSVASLRTVLADFSADEGERRHALAVLSVARDPQLATILQALLDDSAFRPAAIRELAAFDHAATAEALLTRYSSLSPADRSAALSTLAARPDYAAAALTAMEAGRIPRADLTPFLARQLAGLDDDRVTALLTRLYGVSRGGDTAKRELVAKYRRVYENSADWMFSAEQGRAIYDRACAQCHKLHGAGGDIGPDLSATNRLDLDYLLENVVDPNALIGHDYQLTMVRLNDGRVLSGIIEQSGDQTVTVKMLTDSETVQRTDIAGMDRLEISMMPEGLLDGLTEMEVQNLLKYLRNDRQVPAAQ